MDKTNPKVPCALIFFNRPEPLAKSFAAIRDYRPDKLFLIQDGARANRLESDSRLIAQCRDVVETVDWPCEVVKIYSDKNLGCGYRIYSGVKQAFEHVDRLAIIEDDIVCSPAFFEFQEEMLERYKDDSRIHMVSGMNPIGEYKRCPYTYFFSSAGGAIWGWGTWKRVWDTFDYTLDWYQDSYVRESVFSRCVTPSYRTRLEKYAEAIHIKHTNGISLTAWSGPFGFTSFLYYRLNIVPRCNLTSNIGLTGDSTHATDNPKLVNKKSLQLFNMQTYLLDKPIIHPNYMFDDEDYMVAMHQHFGTFTYWQRLGGKIENIYRVVRYGGMGYIMKKLAKRK